MNGIVPILNSVRRVYRRRYNTYKRKFPIHHAARTGDQEGVQNLIERGVSVDSRDDCERTPLHGAAECGRYEVAQLLISNHCNVDLKDWNGRTPVMLAAIVWNKNVTDLLLQSGAQINGADKRGYTLLHDASFSGWVDVVQRIVESGETDVNAATVCGDTPLMLAALLGHADVAVLLIRVGADVHRRNKLKRTALHSSAQPQGHLQGHLEVVQVLLKEEGLDLNPQDDEGKTPLHEACYWGFQDIVEQLVIAGADTNIKNNKSETALSVGIRCGISTLEEISRSIRLFVQHGFFFEDCDYVLISENPVLKDNVLKDVDLCTQSIVNRFHCQSLPALYSNPNLAQKLPCIEKFKLNTRQVHDIENFVKWDMQTNTFCNVVKARPLGLGVLCVQSLLAITRQA